VSAGYHIVGRHRSWFGFRRISPPSCTESRCEPRPPACHATLATGRGAAPYPDRTLIGWIRSAYPDAPPNFAAVPRLSDGNRHREARRDLIEQLITINRLLPAGSSLNIPIAVWQKLLVWRSRAGGNKYGFSMQNKSRSPRDDSNCESFSLWMGCNLYDVAPYLR
jgi:hypothetical protein